VVSGISLQPFVIISSLPTHDRCRKDFKSPITRVDVESRQLSANNSIGGTYGLTNDSFYYAYGLKEELDAEGEFILNESTGELSAIFPAECMLNGSVVCPTRLVPATTMTKMACCVPGNCSLSAIVRVIGARNISFSGITISGSTGVGLSIWGSTDITIDACDINNHQVGLLAGAASMHGCSGTQQSPSRGVSLLRSDIGFTGMSSSDFTGGNRTTLTPSHFLIENNRLHDFGLWIYTYNAGVHASGVGIVVRKNEFRSSYHIALFFSGNGEWVPSVLSCPD
jgi:hypothetical protein